MPKPKANHFMSENAAWNRLHAAKKAAVKAQEQQPMGSWWASGLSRAEFYAKAAERHRQILNSASDGTRSLTKVT